MRCYLCAFEAMFRYRDVPVCPACMVAHLEADPDAVRRMVGRAQSPPDMVDG